MAGMNVTESALATIPATSMGWLITIIVIASIVIMLFLVSRNIRRFIAGALVTIGCTLIYWVARWIGSSYGDGDTFPFAMFTWVAGFVVIAWGLGKCMEKLGWLDWLEEDIENAKQTETKDIVI